MSSSEKKVFSLPSIAEIRNAGNKLKNESSLYLRQHSHNPLYWYPWSEEALERSKREDKPIFLSIGYSSCHWCHVMEEKVFEDDFIAQYMNENYVNIKVDREERPDLDSVYMKAVQALTGRGGWPMSVFLTPDLKPFYGGSYFPPENFLALVQRIIEVYKTNREGINQQSKQVYEVITKEIAIQEYELIDESRINAIAENAINMVDKKWGGFINNMKFPTPLRWEFLLHQYRKTGKSSIAEALKLTLNNMGKGGIHDQIGGGFHRYTVESSWLIPHFEKMLYDNAQIATLYIDAYSVFKDEYFKATAKDTLDFMIREMRSPEGGFYSSYDADSGGEEGSFYTWTSEEISAITGEKDANIIFLITGITKKGNFEGRNILTRRKSWEEVAREVNLEKEQVKETWNKWRIVLREKRAERTWPGLDKKIITSWNGLAIIAFARAGLIFNDQKYLNVAKEATDYLLGKHLKQDYSLLRSSTEGQISGEAILDDYVFLAYACLELFQASSEIKYLENSIKLIRNIDSHFISDKKSCYLTPDYSFNHLGRQIEINDSVEPSANAMLLMLKLKLSAITGNAAWRDEVISVIKNYSETLVRSGMEMAKWLQVANFLNSTFIELVIISKSDSIDNNELMKVFREINPANSTILFINENNITDEIKEILPTLSGKDAGKNSLAYVCQQGSCLAPVSDPEELRKQLLSEWKY